MGKRLTGLLGVMVMLAGCSDAPRELSLQLLANEQSTIDGHRVVTEGVVRSFADPLHYWLEDDALHRVALTPDAEVADYVGEMVRVEGRFHADRERGRRIEVITLTRLAD
ncbi:MAG: hypothetical protein JJU03_12135 [Idiomarina sp.]|nr:hypothetical protein [Idiomarina sp.]